MTSIEREIYDRLKHIVDNIYRSKGISSPEIRKHFLIKRNFTKIIHSMRDLEHIYKERKYPINFETTVYDILFYRILLDRVYYEKDNPVDETSIQNYDKFVESLNESKKMEKKDFKDFKLDEIPMRELTKIVASYEHNGKKSGDEKIKQNYLELAKKYQDEIDKRQKELNDRMSKKIDKDGKWIRGGS